MSGRVRAIVAVVVVGAAFFGMRTAVAPDYGQRNHRFLPDMADSPAVGPLEPAAELPLGIAAQPLVDGVVPRGMMPFEFGTGPEEAQRAGAMLANPFAPEDLEARARGAERFGTFCSHCHGRGGAGDGAVARRGMVPPPSLLGARARTIADGEIYHIITRGQGNMAPHAALVSEEDRWRIILHLRALQGGAGQ